MKYKFNHVFLTTVHCRLNMYTPEEFHTAELGSWIQV